MFIWIELVAIAMIAWIKLYFSDQLYRIRYSYKIRLNLEPCQYSDFLETRLPPLAEKSDESQYLKYC